MTTRYFGERWDAPLLDDDADVQQVPTPVGEPCYVCSQTIVGDDRGLMRGCVSMGDDGRPVGEMLWVHTECDMLGVLGHRYWVCSCSGYDTSSRGAALELLRRLNAIRAQQGMGPM